MLPVLWLESFSEEEETVKRTSTLPNDFLFSELPIHQLDPDKLPDNFIASIRTHSQFDKSITKRVSCVISRSTGYDHLLEQQTLLEGIPTGHLSEYATQAVAEHNLTISLALLKHLNREQNAMENFERSNLTGNDLFNRSIGIVGVGKIGEATARLFMKLGLDVHGHDIHEKQTLEASDSFEYTSLENLFQTSNTVILCLPHTDQTDGLITRSLLQKLPEGSILINSGRGEVVSSQQLLEALNNGSISGLGLDVYQNEAELVRALRHDVSPETLSDETRANLKLIRNERVIATPHNAFNSRGSVKNKVDRTLENIERFNQGKPLVNPVF